MPWLLLDGIQYGVYSAQSKSALLYSAVVAVFGRSSVIA